MHIKSLTLCVSLGLAALTGCAPHTTGSTEVGVRTNKVGGLFTKGVLDNVYTPGSTTFLPLVVHQQQKTEMEHCSKPRQMSSRPN